MCCFALKRKCQNLTTFSVLPGITDILVNLVYFNTYKYIICIFVLFSACYPFYDNDPLVIENCPDVYFTGNQSKFETKTIEVENGKFKSKKM